MLESRRGNTGAEQQIEPAQKEESRALHRIGESNNTSDTLDINQNPQPHS